MPAPDEPSRGGTPANSAQPPSFEEGLAQLAELVNRLEGGGLGLTESIAAYERGVVILRALHEELGRAEERIRVLTTVDEEGRPITEPFGGTTGNPQIDPATDGGDEKPGRRPASRGSARRPASRPPTLPGMDESSAEA